MSLSLRKKGQDEELVINRPENLTSSYSWGDVSGKLEFQFAINEPGVYEFSGAYEPGATGSPIVLSVGKENFWSIFTSIIIFSIIAMAIFSLLAYIIIMYFIQLVRWFKTRVS